MPRKAKNGLTIAENVRSILRTFPEARNNDNLLFAYYWGLIDEVDFEGDFDSFMEGFKYATPPSSLQRVRQLINYEAIEDNYLPTNEKVRKLRTEKAEVMRTKHGRMMLLGDVNNGEEN
jgi:hypothetical protein